MNIQQVKHLKSFKLASYWERMHFLKTGLMHSANERVRLGQQAYSVILKGKDFWVNPNFKCVTWDSISNIEDTHKEEHKQVEPRVMIMTYSLEERIK